MITGFNTDVKHGAIVYHVQTEDKGRSNPKIESLVYVGGEILDNYRTSYEDSTDLKEEHIMAMLEAQHKRVIRTIKIGKYDEPAPFPEDVISDLPLSEVIFNYLEQEPAPDLLQLVTHGIPELNRDHRGLLGFKATRSESQTPVSGVQIRVKLSKRDGRMVVLFQGETDRTGSFSHEANLTKVPPGEYVLGIQAISEFGAAEQEFPLHYNG